MALGIPSFEAVARTTSSLSLKDSFHATIRECLIQYIKFCPAAIETNHVSFLFPHELRGEPIGEHSWSE
jgi:hypothetical protein